MRTSRWPVAAKDSDFDPYLVGRPETSVALFRRFIAMVRDCGPMRFELQNDAVVLRGSRRIFAGATVTDRGLLGHLNLPRQLSDRRILRVDPLTKHLFMNRFLITASPDLDKRFGQWLREAHGVGEGAHLKRPES